MDHQIRYRAPVDGDEHAISQCMLAAGSLAEMTAGTPESIEEWYQICSPRELRARIVSGERSLVAVCGGEVVGFIAFKRGSHLSLLYVRKDYAGRGIGRQLFARCARDLAAITVNSSMGAVGFYRKMGFVVMGVPQVGADGVQMTPMAWTNPSRS